MLLRLAACNTSSPTNTTPPTSKQNKKSKTKSPLKTWQWKINHFFLKEIHHQMVKWLAFSYLSFLEGTPALQRLPKSTPHLGRFTLLHGPGRQA